VTLAATSYGEPSKRENVADILSVFGGILPTASRQHLEAPPKIARFTESGRRGWQSVPGGTPETGNLPPGYPQDAGATKTQRPPLRRAPVFFKNAQVNTDI